MTYSSFRSLHQLLLLSLSVLLILSSCSSARKLKRETKKNMELSKTIVKALQDNALAPKVFKAKTKIKYTSPAFSQNFSVDIRMRKDSVIWMTAYPSLVKIPVGYVLITPDSVKVIDRFNKKAYLKDISYAEELLGYPVDFYSLQNIILGNMPLTPSHHPKINSQKDNLYELTYAESPIDVILNVEGTAGTQFDIQKVSLIDSLQNRQLHMKQSNFKQLGTGSFPQDRDIILEGAMSAKAKINFSKFEIPEKLLKFPFPLKRSYEITR